MVQENGFSTTGFGGKFMMGREKSAQLARRLLQSPQFPARIGRE
jgi:hypothetical protein